MTIEATPHSTLRERGQLTLPLAVRESLGLEPGDRVEFEIVDNTAVLRAYKLVPAEQTWFWAESWQRGEREASEDIERGATKVFKDTESFLASLGD